MEIDIKTSSIVSTSKKKGKGSARSRMLKMIMPMLSGQNAEQLGKAIEDNNPELAKSVMSKISKELETKLDKKK